MFNNRTDPDSAGATSQNWICEPLPLGRTNSHMLKSPESVKSYTISETSTTDTSMNEDDCEDFNSRDPSIIYSTSSGDQSNSAVNSIDSFHTAANDETIGSSANDVGDNNEPTDSNVTDDDEQSYTEFRESDVSNDADAATNESASSESGDEESSQSESSVNGIDSFHTAANDEDETIGSSPNGSDVGDNNEPTDCNVTDDDEQSYTEFRESDVSNDADAATNESASSESGDEESSQSESSVNGIDSFHTAANDEDETIGSSPNGSDVGDNNEPTDSNVTDDDEQSYTEFREADVSNDADAATNESASSENGDEESSQSESSVNGIVSFQTDANDEDETIDSSPNGSDVDDNEDATDSNVTDDDKSSYTEFRETDVSSNADAATNESVSGDEECAMQIDGKKVRRSWSLEECAICCEIMLKDHSLLYLICAHKFHMQCVQPWLQNKHTCPVCRKAV